MKLFLVGKPPFNARTFEVVEYNPETRVAVLKNERGEEFIDPNFIVDDVLRKQYNLVQSEE